MSVVADFSVPAEAFCLGETLAAVPGATVELDRLVAHSPDYVMPFVWVLGVEETSFDAALAADPTVETASVSDSFDDTHLYQVTWAELVSERLAVVLDHDGVLLEARGASDEWRFSVRFGTQDHFTDFREHFREFGTVTVHRLTSPRTPGGAPYGVTPKQRAALIAAYDGGYYETPRGTSGEAIAEQFGISQQAVSMRLRRGVATLIENTIGRHREEDT